ncbi:transmembrane protein 71 [Callorhinchus milii]|uniref:Transmembrane protein 71 n=1 Tax=Callorhinchus milii TaxID=7868 RepID=A0A4W3GSL9_CALMI|nr:transmembrane protein 71 [Callorhinchus milii]|eukprot:gi/632941816/ref/XP_007886077.1/ PREDICTED: transmembrane protein 71 [Callorhinchus milii]
MYPASPYFSSPLQAGTQMLQKETDRDEFSDEALQSSSFSLLPGETPSGLFNLNTVTGSPFVYRRSPRLLSNGYYDLSEESFMDEDGNITLTPSKMNISYKENLVRIFRRRRRVRRSLANLFNIKSSVSWLNSSLFSGAECPLAESSWIDGGSDFESSFSNNQEGTTDFSEKSWLSEENTPSFNTESLMNTEVCSTEGLLVTQSTEGILDLPPHSQLLSAKCFCSHMPKGPDAAAVKNFFFYLIILTLCVCVAVFVRWFSGGLGTTLLTSTLVFTAVLYTAKSAFPSGVKTHDILRPTQTEEITSKND